MRVTGSRFGGGGGGGQAAGEQVPARSRPRPAPAREAQGAWGVGGGGAGVEAAGGVGAGRGFGSRIGLVRGFGFAGGSGAAAEGCGGAGAGQRRRRRRSDGTCRRLRLQDRGPCVARAAARAPARARWAPPGAAARSGTRRRAPAAAPGRVPARRCSPGAPRPGRDRHPVRPRDRAATSRRSARGGRRSRGAAPPPRPPERPVRRGSGGGSNVVTGAGVPGSRGAVDQTPSAATVQARSSLRRIVPFDAVGSASTNSTSRGTLSSGSVCRRCCRISATSRSEPASPGASTTNARTYCPPRWRSRTPTTPAFATDRCPRSACSISNGLNLRPPLVTTSVARPRSRTEPSCSRTARSPVMYMSPRKTARVSSGAFQ